MNIYEINEIESLFLTLWSNDRLNDCLPIKHFQKIYSTEFFNLISTFFLFSII